ncbi:hypothetical protein BD324DRAFT_251346 [Kockovaella imperatae]|uniref:Uncharacterized protein n=1 Tax=Kockovaella imperatae TaxID=4999 RepID=A0A1Y1UPV1_9TREE|nr:hypothetical protein BD324DRAFT_251346 [Kockovaella imperatae]ORX40029.1 hypothetical protein BD324DRAFT_251346 [Kockovaella imperatae]
MRRMPQMVVKGICVKVCPRACRCGYGTFLDDRSYRECPLLPKRLSAGRQSLALSGATQSSSGIDANRLESSSSSMSRRIFEGLYLRAPDLAGLLGPYSMTPSRPRSDSRLPGSARTTYFSPLVRARLPNLLANTTLELRAFRRQEA